MTASKQQEMEERLKKLKAENEGMRKELSSVRKEQRALQKLLKERVSFFNALPVAIVTVQEEKIVDMNPMALDLLGYTAEDWTGRNFIDFVDPDSKEAVLHIHRSRVSGKWAPDQYETTLVAKDGSLLRFDVRVQKIRHGGRILLVARLESIEERKKKERELVDSEKKEALLTMASGVTHSLSSPLKVITEKAIFLKKKADPKSRSLMEPIDTIQDAATQMMRLNQALKGFCKDTQDKSEVTLCDLKKIVMEVISITEPSLKEKEERGVKINLKTYLRSVSFVEANSKDIQDMLTHIMINAIDAMPQGGNLYLSTEENAGFAYVFVQDSGVGIPEHLQTRVFDPFFTTKGSDRHGLGLSLSQGIARRHQGVLEIASGRGQGTIVSIRIPLARHGQETAKRTARKKIKDSHILIIEDDHLIRELLCQLLRGKGFKVIPAVNGVEGFHHLKKKTVDMVIVGSQTPDTEGHILAREIKRAHAQLPVALIAGHEASAPTRKSGADLLITKPLDMHQVLNQISDVLSLSMHGR